MIKIFQDINLLSEAAANLIADAAQKSIAEKGNFYLVLSGGETPRNTYELLASEKFQHKINWQKVSIFFGDERYVPHTDPQSNYRMAQESLLKNVPIPSENIFPIPTNSTPQKDALEYEKTLEDIFPEETPAFDLVLLGLGDNAHTASLFPHTPVLHEDLHWVKDVFVAEQNSHRITLTASAINGANEIIFLVSGMKKAAAIHHVLNGKPDVDNFPAQLIQPEKGELIWLIDKDAASMLK